MPCGAVLSLLDLYHIFKGFLVNVQIKVGSVLRVPAPAGLSVVSLDPTTLTVTTQGGVLVATAVKPGVAILSIQAGHDVMGTWVVSVVAQ